MPRGFFMPPYGATPQRVYRAIRSDIVTISYPIDLALPGAVDDLLAYHRAVFGAARMQTDEAPSAEEDAGSGEARTDSPKPAPPSSEADRRDADQLGDAGKKALAEERKAKAAEKRRADDAERRLAELERERMTDAEKVAAERDDWRKKYEEQSATLAARELAALRTEVAAERGLTLTQARRLIGSTREELEADADAFKAELPAAPQSPFPPNTPKPDPSQGRSSGRGGGRATSVADAQAEHMARIARTST